MIVRLGTVALMLLTGCAAPPPRVDQAKHDPAREAGYQEAVEQLTALNREAEALWKRGKSDQAAAAMTRGQSLQARLLAVPQPKLEALIAVSDLDDLYARMLLSNGHDGWARLLFQKNLIRWKMWKPQTADTARRLRETQARIAECDRHLKQ